MNNVSKSELTRSHILTHQVTIKKIVDIGKEIDKKINKWIGDYNKDKENYMVRRPEELQSDEESHDSNQNSSASINSDDDSVDSVNYIDVFLEEVPKIYKPYMRDCIKDYLVEKEEYDEWLRSDLDKTILPEVDIVVPLDETETPGTENW